MNTHTNKKQEDKSRAIANNLATQQSNHTGTSQLVHNHPQAVAQKALHEMANNSTQVKQLQDVQAMTYNHHPAPVQFTKIKEAGVVQERSAVFQLQQWKYVKKIKVKRFEPYGKWHSVFRERPKTVEIDKDGGPEQIHCEGDKRPKDRLFNGDIFDDVTGYITTAEENKLSIKKKRHEGYDRKDKESARKHDLQTGEGFKSARLKKIKKEEYQELLDNLETDLDTGIHHMGGDSPGHDYDFEDEGLHSAVNNRVELQYVEQVKAIKEDKEDLIEWLKIPEELRNEIIKYQSIAESNTDMIHHSKEERPKFTSSVLGSGTKERPPLKEDTKHTGIGWRKDNLSHSIPYAQVPDSFRHDEEGGVNHPKNIPYENMVTNQVVNVAIEKIGQKLLDDEKSITKVTVRIWGIDHIERSIHIYFVEGYKYPFVFGTKDLGKKLPERWDK